MFRRLFLLEMLAAMILSLPVAAVDIPVGTVALCNYETLKTYEDGATVVLKAVWEANKYNVTYDKGEHATTTGTAYVDTAVFDENYTVPSAAIDAIDSVAGYKFVGFNTESGKTESNFPGSEETPWKRTSNLTVYAAYAVNKANITYNCGNSTSPLATAGSWIGENEVNPVEVIYDSIYSHPTGVNVCKLGGYDFDKWYCVEGTTSMVNGGTTHESNGIVEDKWGWDVGDVTCTALWMPKSYSCAAGYYLKSSSDFIGCAGCPKDSYCPGFEEHMYNESDYGSKACPEGYITDEGGYAKSKQECYKETVVPCAEKNPYTYGNGTAVYATTEVTCKQYFGNESNCTLSDADKDACNIVSLECDEGYEQREVDGSLRCVEKYIECDAGQYLPSDSKVCVECTVNNYCPGGRYEVSKSQDQGINACPGTLKSPVSSRSENDCGVILHVDGDIVYLHSDKRKSPSLAVSVNGKTWYADTTPIEEGSKSMSSDTTKSWHVVVDGKEYTIHSPIFE